MLLTVLDGRVEDQSYVVKRQLRSMVSNLVKLLLAVCLQPAASHPAVCVQLCMRVDAGTWLWSASMLEPESTLYRNAICCQPESHTYLQFRRIPQYKKNSTNMCHLYYRCHSHCSGWGLSMDLQARPKPHIPQHRVYISCLLDECLSMVKYAFRGTHYSSCWLRWYLLLTYLYLALVMVKSSDPHM
jgi:hypothetical protein